MTDDATPDDANRDVLADASEEELAAAARLRDALEQGELPRIGPVSDELLLAQALGHAFAPRDLDGNEHARILAAALHPAPALGLAPPRARRGRTVLVASVSFGGALALAASVLLVLGMTRSAPMAASGPSSDVSVVTAATALVPRSTEPLFVREGRPLGRQGSARIDRIASARSGEYLQARLARLGAR